MASARNIALTGAITGNANFDGSGNVSITTKQGNIAVITGNITTPAANSETTTGTVRINYPSGYNRTNCVVVSIMGGKQGNSDILTTPMPVGAGGGLMGASGIAVTLDTNNILVRKEKIDVIEPTKTTAFKIVLMKIA